MKELINSLDRIKGEVAELESRIAALEGAGEVEETAGTHSPASDEAIDLDFINAIDEDGATDVVEDLPVDESSVEAVDDLPADSGSVAPAETEPEATSVEETAVEEKEEPLGEDDFDDGNLFGGMQEVKAEPNAPAHKHARKTLNEKESAEAGKAVMDMKADKLAWKTDIPGSPVKDIRSAISLNDKVMFISALFREDSMLMQDVIANLNAMESLDQAEAYLRGLFPEWKMGSDHVYRFMMAVRRKVR